MRIVRIYLRIDLLFTGRICWLDDLAQIPDDPMIVCVCNNVSDHKIRQAVDEGMTSLAELRQNLNVGTCCGKCHSCAKQVIRDRLASQPDSVLSLMPIAA